MSPERQLDDYIAKWAIQALARWVLTVAVILGVLIVIGGDDRFADASYAAALRYPYAPESWGVILTALGLAGIVFSLFGRLKLAASMLYGQGVWSLFFAYSFAKAASDDPLAGTTGPVIYVGMAVTASLLGLVHWKSATALRRD